FQAEDGIRDYKVTGVQTCALPIYNKRPLIIGLIVVIGVLVLTLVGVIAFVLGSQRGTSQQNLPLAVKDPTPISNVTPTSAVAPRSEERRVGKECRSRRVR